MEDYYKKYLKYKNKYLSLKELIGGSTQKYDVCKAIKGLEQTDATCWFDSIIMALLIPTKMNKLWAHVLEQKYELTYLKLIMDTKANNYSFRRYWLDKYGRMGTKIPDTIDQGGYPVSLLELFTEQGLIELNADITLEYKYGGKTKKNNIFEITKYANVIPSNDITFLNSPKFFACYFIPKNFPRQEGISIKKNFVSNGSTYILQSIVLVANQHIISYLLCRDKWYVYDNERARLNQKLLEINFKITKDGNNEYYQFDDHKYENAIWSPNRTIVKTGFGSNVKTNESFNIYLYAKI